MPQKYIYNGALLLYNECVGRFESLFPDLVLTSAVVQTVQTTKFPDMHPFCGVHIFIFTHFPGRAQSHNNIERNFSGIIPKLLIFIRKNGIIKDKLDSCVRK